MDPLSAGGIFIGRWFGINVRIHFTLIIFAIFRLQGYGREYLVFGIALIVGMYFCILLHEFGHALAARWCDGDADEILLWPLGGLAFCRPPFHPTAHLITAAAGPFVTFLIWGVLAIVTPLLPINYVDLGGGYYSRAVDVTFYLELLKDWNLLILFFNLIPAFPMDGGRILRDTLWHFLTHRTASQVAMYVGWVCGGGMVVYGLVNGNTMLAVLGGFQLFASRSLEVIMAGSGSGAYSFSLRERFKRAKRKREFHGKIKGADQVLHECATCGRTEKSDPYLHFIYSAREDKEYCEEHKPDRPG